MRERELQMDGASTRGILSEGAHRPVAFAQRGDANHEAIWTCAERIVEVLLAKGVSQARAKRVRHVVVELLENVMHYGDTVRESACREYAVEVWLEEDGGVDVSCSNLVQKRDVLQLSKHLERVCGCTPLEANWAVREVLLEDVDFPSGAAGIGLLTVRQRSERMEWSFVLEGDQYERYTIALRVL